MAYSADSFVADEQPTTAKWNKLWTNDASFNDGTGIGDDTIDSRHYVAGSVDYEHLGSDVGGYQVLYDSGEQVGTSTSMSSGTITAKNLLRIFAWVLPSGGTLNVGLRFNNDSGNNYAEVGAGGSIAQCNMRTVIDANNVYTEVGVYNTAAQEKLLRLHSVERSAAGAANAPTQKSTSLKWANASSAITRVDVVDTGGTGDIGAGSRLLVLGK
jgi:hypothetical protein